MRLDNSVILIDNLQMYAFHGVMEQERRVGGWFDISVRVHYNILRAIQTDDVNDTLSYAELLEVVKSQMAQPSNLLEHVASRIGKAVLERFPEVENVEIKLLKLNPPMGADCKGAGVEVKMRNDK